MTGDTTDRDLLTRYAELIVRVGANVQAGQLVDVRGLVEHVELVRAIATAAYDAGAGLVEVEYDDQHVRRDGIAYGASAALADAPAHAFAALDRLRHQHGALIRLTGNPEPHLMDDLDPAAVAAAEPRALTGHQMQLTMSGEVSWTVAAAPGPGWAAAVFGEPDVDRLWHAVAVAVGLDEPDPVASWQERVATLEARAAAVQALDLDAVHLTGPGTDLTVGLIPGCRWLGGGLRTSAGVAFVPNIPTEEVFTSPDRTRAEGIVRITRPLVMPASGVLVEGLQLELDGGVIVDVRAERGRDAAVAQMDSDPNGRRLGEIALVDKESRVRRAGVVFHDTLYDENAGAHLAWGCGFPTVLPGGHGPADAERLGLNVARVHTDVVVGGPGVSITGVTRGGRRVALIDDDAWVLPVGDRSAAPQ